MPKGILSCDNISKTYRMDGVQFTAISDASFTIQEGEYVAIMGPSGSGKSTLMHILGCLDRPTTGTLLIDGRDSAGASDIELARIRNKKI